MESRVQLKAHHIAHDDLRWWSASASNAIEHLKDTGQLKFMLIDRDISPMKCDNELQEAVDVRRYGTRLTYVFL